MKTEEYKDLDVLMSSDIINARGEDNNLSYLLPYKEKCIRALY